MISFVSLLDLLLILVSIVLMTVGYVRDNKVLLIVGAICVVIASIILLGLMCAESFWRGFFGVDRRE